jgi:sugar/nucleoside kinase (ribokinase family)
MMDRLMIVVFGTICLDRNRRVPVLLAPGEYTEVLEEVVVLGGEAANTAFTLQTWGRDIQLFGNALGFGAEAELLLRLLREKGLPTEFMREGTSPTPVCDIYVTPDGDRTMYGRGFGDMEAATVLDGMPVIEGEWFVAEPNMGELAREAARLAVAGGMKTYLMDYLHENEPIEPGSFWQSCADWTGTRGDVEATVKWTQEWVDRYGCFAVVTDGGRGLVAGSPDRAVRAYPVFPCPTVVDSTGAGDAFRAGMVFGLDQGWSVSDCLRFGSAAGCLNCRTLGAITQVPSVEEIRQHIEAHPEIGEAYE